jgi:hypothetical protein
MTDQPKIFRNRNFKKRDHDCTNVVCCKAAAAPTPDWIPCKEADLVGMMELWTEAGVTYFGWL